MSDVAPDPNRRAAVSRWWLVLGAFGLLLLLGSCRSGDGDEKRAATSSTRQHARSSTRAATWKPGCPKGTSPRAGLNTGFPSDGAQRQFYAAPPRVTKTPRPVFVAVTGTVQPEPDFLRQSGLDQLAAKGWLVITPVRTCSARGTNCNGTGMENDGRVWEPWFDGHPDPKHDEGPDVRFVEAAVKCAATRWNVDQRRIYIGGISAGGSFTNRALTFDSGFFAGGIPSSGNWYPVDGGPEGLCCPRPLPRMTPAVVILTWGGPTDRWPPTDTPLAVYGPETKIASQYYAGQPSVVTVSCSGTHGHIWPTAMTTWMAATLLSHPKGSDPASFRLTTPPAGFTCVRGAYTDH